MSDRRIRDARVEELDGWDERTVDVEGGSVHQSRAWARYQQEFGWTPRFLVTYDDRRVLALERLWPLAPGGEAYLPRGPVTAGDDAMAVADRARAVSDFLARGDIDVVVSDAEIPAESGYAAAMRARGFEQAEEVQPSRHRLSIPLSGGGDRAACFSNFSMSARQRVRGAMKAGVRIERLDGATDLATTQFAIDTLYAMLADASTRRRFRVVTRGRFAAWATSALASGLAEMFTAYAPDARPLGAGLFHRHGRRLTYFFGADVAAERRQFPGVMHLLLWRALEHALETGMSELDLGGVDVAGARRRPVPGDPMYGLLAFKESLGARWIELTGSQRRVMHPLRYGVGRAAQRLDGRLHRPDRPVRRLATA